jgi:hypothetical protein
MFPLSPLRAEAVGGDMRRRFRANDFYWIYVYVYVYVLADALCGCRCGTASIKTANLEYEIVRRRGTGGAGKSFF